ncbi:hypothetical protein AAVH_12309 [Aphelenchoides avenae]|nr:hypothetical protein AAVH_12309 [Aphelenchus avenae]
MYSAPLGGPYANADECGLESSSSAGLAQCVFRDCGCCGGPPGGERSMRQAIFLAVWALAAVSATTTAHSAKQVEKRQLGAVIYSEDIENRTSVGMLRIDKELFRGLGSMARGDSNRYPVEVKDQDKSFLELIAQVEKGCTRLGNSRTLTGKETEIPIAKHVEEFVISQQGEVATKLRKAVELYRAVFDALLQRPTSFNDLQAGALKKSLGKMTLSEKSGMQFIERMSTLSDVGCVNDDTLLVNVTFAYAKKDRQHKLTEIMDYGHFLKNQEYFVRAQIARKWVNRKERWESLDDFDNKCSLILTSHGEDLWTCPRSAATRSSECNPSDVFNQCRPSVHCVKDDGFVLLDKTGDDRVVLATVQKTYRLMRTNGTWSDEPMPASGVVVLSIPVGESVLVGADSQTTIEGTNRIAKTFSAIPVNPAQLPINESLLTEAACSKDSKLVFTRTGRDGPAMLVSEELARVEELEQLANETRWGLVVVMLLLVITLLSVAIAGYFYRAKVVVFVDHAYQTIKKHPATAATTPRVATPRSPRRSIFKQTLFPAKKSRSQTGTELAVSAEEGRLASGAVEAGNPLVESAVDVESTLKE